MLSTVRRGVPGAAGSQGHSTPLGSRVRPSVKIRRLNRVQLTGPSPCLRIRTFRMRLLVALAINHLGVVAEYSAGVWIVELPLEEAIVWAARGWAELLERRCES